MGTMAVRQGEQTPCPGLGFTGPVGCGDGRNPEHSCHFSRLLLPWGGTVLESASSSSLCPTPSPRLETGPESLNVGSNWIPILMHLWSIW